MIPHQHYILAYKGKTYRKYTNATEAALTFALLSAHIANLELHARDWRIAG